MPARRPPGDVLHRVGEDGLVGTAVVLPVGLDVAVDAEDPDLDPAVGAALVDGGHSGRPAGIRQQLVDAADGQQRAGGGGLGGGHATSVVARTARLGV